MLITKTLPILIVGGTVNYYRSKGVVCNVGDKINLPVEMLKKNIHAHHLNSWKHFSGDRFEVNNLITLCNPCHKQYHKLIKLKDATKENFNIYLNNIKEQSASV